MKKLDKIREYFVVNNITNFIAAEGTTYYHKYRKKGQSITTYHLSFYSTIPTIYNSFQTGNNEYLVDFILCNKEMNISYFIDFTQEKRRLQKIGNFEQGSMLIANFCLFYYSGKYNDSIIFLDWNKQSFSELGLENIKKYEKFWEQKLNEYPECDVDILKRFEHNSILQKRLQRKVKLMKLN